ncbi:membrane protein insertion efficiency factor YidD (plasmid) [Saccharothrix sp. AJ9571]|nr:membrane protein insertion efficiency factor YidD [Saccharothrix sp. AJ9571]
MPARVLLLGVRFYRAVLAPQLPAGCRFTPTCSAYAQQALTRHGALRGTVLALRRLARCRPGVPRGEDPVPDPAPRCSLPPCRVSWTARRRRRRIEL